MQKSNTYRTLSWKYAHNDLLSFSDSNNSCKSRRLRQETFSVSFKVMMTLYLYAGNRGTGQYSELVQKVFFGRSAEPVREVSLEE
jgi:hypothetical protein